MATSVAIIEDNPEFLAKFAEIIESSPGFSLSGKASNGADGMALVNQTGADIYLIDLGLPDMDGIEIIKHAANVRPASEIMVITVFADDAHVMASIEAGATGYILKDSSAQEIRESIHMLRNGGSPISPVIARRILQKFRVDKPGNSVTAPALVEARTNAIGTELTGREVDVLQSLARGLSFKEIGDMHHISAHTVTSHVKNIYRKLAVHSRGEAVYEATKRGLIQP